MSEPSRLRPWRIGHTASRRLGAVVLSVATLTAVLAIAAARLTGTTAHATSGCFHYAVRTNNWIYHRDQPVNVIVTATNITSHTCIGEHCGGITPWIEVRYFLGNLQMYRSSPVGITCALPRNPPPLPMIRPGHSQVWIGGGWDQMGQEMGTCKPGDCHSYRPIAPVGWYRITWHWLDTLSVQTGWFVLSA